MRVDSGERASAYPAFCALWAVSKSVKWESAVASSSPLFSPASPLIAIKRPSPTRGIFRKPLANYGSNPSPRCWTSPRNAKSKSIIVRFPMCCPTGVSLHCGVNARTPLLALEWAASGCLIQLAHVSLKQGHF